ncbi:MAG: flagellar motor switch protein FliG, partial [Pseudobdellovibrio sp.]
MKISKLDNVDYDSLRGIDKAAILVNYLGKDAIRTLFQKMDDTDIRKLIHLMSKFKIVPVNITKRVLEEFYETLNESDEFIFSDRMSSKDAIIEALGEERARGILGGLNLSNSGTRSLESLEML